MAEENNVRASETSRRVSSLQSNLSQRTMQNVIGNYLNTNNSIVLQRATNKLNTYSRGFLKHDQLLKRRQEANARIQQLNQNYVVATQDVLNDETLKFLVDHSKINVPTFTSIVAGFELARASRADKLKQLTAGEQQRIISDIEAEKEYINASDAYYGNVADTAGEFATGLMSGNTNATNLTSRAVNADVSQQYGLENQQRVQQHAVNMENLRVKNAIEAEERVYNAGGVNNVFSNDEDNISLEEATTTQPQEVRNNYIFKPEVRNEQEVNNEDIDYSFNPAERYNDINELQRLAERTTSDTSYGERNNESNSFTPNNVSNEVLSQMGYGERDNEHNLFIPDNVSNEVFSQMGYSRRNDEELQRPFGSEIIPDIQNRIDTTTQDLRSNDAINNDGNSQTTSVQPTQAINPVADMNNQPIETGQPDVAQSVTGDTGNVKNTATVTLPVDQFQSAFNDPNMQVVVNPDGSVSFVNVVKEGGD